MDPTIEFRVHELLCSRLCHDLISPVSAINNGMELMAEDEGELGGEIRDLLQASASAASAKLQFYRIAYGLGGHGAPPIGLAEAGRLAQGVIGSDKVVLDWCANGGSAGDAALKREETKLLLNLVLLAVEGLPRGGRIAVEARGAPAREVVVAGTGTGAGLKPESADALLNGVSTEALTARTVQGYFVARLARMLGTAPALESPGPDSFTLRVRLAA